VILFIAKLLGIITAIGKTYEAKIALISIHTYPGNTCPLRLSFSVFSSFLRLNSVILVFKQYLCLCMNQP